ncbi:adenylosuccinate lyase [Clostridiaceae bacterium HFYG-1003]|nr:adenylosuccinate lyase [Clostridiaceae bacterium HFYG-1003]
MEKRTQYNSPLTKRYSGDAMSYLFSEEYKFKTWRRLWLALAEAESELGLPITGEQLENLRAHLDDINYEAAEAREKEVRHDVMSHVHAFGLQAEKARGIIHLGATSCYVGDNTDLIVMREAMLLIRRKLVAVIRNLKRFALETKDLPTLGFTHYQPAQLTTVGKRASLWLQDLVMDFEEVEHALSIMKFRGVKGTTGTQASFMALFDGDEEKVRLLDQKVSEKFGFKPFAVTGQTYPRKLDSILLNTLSVVAQSAYKFSNDLRLLQNLKEMEEPFEKNQIGSSAMAYKRNPMRSERMGSLARYIIINSLNPAITASTQWFERTLDDSANKRVSVPEAFLALDGVLSLYQNITEGMVVYEKQIQRRIMSELPFMATENILMAAVKQGGDRQELHERIREHSMAAARVVKEEGKDNDLLTRLLNDPAFGLDQAGLDQIMDPSQFIGRAPSQVVEMIRQEVHPILAQFEETDEATDIRV